MQENFLLCKENVYMLLWAWPRLDLRADAANWDFRSPLASVSARLMMRVSLFSATHLGEDWAVLGPGHAWRRDFAGLGLIWRGFAEEGGLGGLRWGDTAWELGLAEMVFILSPPPACKESFILNPLPLLTPP